MQTYDNVLTCNYLPAVQSVYALRSTLYLIRFAVTLVLLPKEFPTLFCLAFTCRDEVLASGRLCVFFKAFDKKGFDQILSYADHPPYVGNTHCPVAVRQPSCSIGYLFYLPHKIQSFLTRDQRCIFRIQVQNTHLRCFARISLVVMIHRVPNKTS